MAKTWKDGAAIIEPLFDFETFDEVEIENVVKENGGTIKWGDSGISDGCEEYEEDNYVMYYSADITDCNGETRWVKFYYGDITREIGLISVMN